MAEEMSAAERYEQLEAVPDKRWWVILLNAVISKGTMDPVVIQVRDRIDGRIVYEVKTDYPQRYGDAIANDLATLTVGQFKVEYGLD